MDVKERACRNRHHASRHDTSPDIIGMLDSCAFIGMAGISKATSFFQSEALSDRPPQDAVAVVASDEAPVLTLPVLALSVVVAGVSSPVL